MSNLLDNKTVQVVITLPASELALNLRPFVLSLGIDGQPPVFEEGLFPDIEAKLRTLWWQFIPQANATVDQKDDAATDEKPAEAKADMPKAGFNEVAPVAEPTLSLF